MQNIKSLVYSIILIGACAVALLTLGLWPVDTQSAHTKAIRMQIARSSEDISKAVDIISAPKIDGRVVEGRLSPMTILQKTRADMASSIRDNNQAIGADLAEANQILCRINCSQGYYYQKKINEYSGMLENQIGELEKNIGKLGNMQSMIRDMVSLQDISDQEISKALAEDTKEIDQRTEESEKLTREIAVLENRRKELEATASVHLEQSSNIRDEIIADAGIEAQKKLETAITEKQLASTAMDEANNVLLKIDELKSSLKINTAMLENTNKRVQSYQQELAKRKVLRDTMNRKLAGLKQEIDVVDEQITASCRAIAETCTEIGQAQNSAMTDFTEAFKAAQAAQRTASKEQIAQTYATEGDAYMSSVAMLNEISAAVSKAQLVESKLTAITADRQPKCVEIIKNLVTVSGALQNNASENLDKAASAYKKAASRSKTEDNWVYKIQEYQARIQRFKLTGQQEDKNAADELLKTLEGLKETNARVQQFLMTV